MASKISWSQTWADITTFEPARLQALYASLTASLLIVGVSVPSGIDAKVQVALAALVTLSTFIHANFLRAKVTPNASAGTLDYTATDAPQDGPDDVTAG
jgi:hypothetical protein